jgi:ketosteroid isomerase-like protein
LVDDGHFFEFLADDVAFEFIITVPGYPRRVAGRHNLIELHRGYHLSFFLDRCFDLRTHRADDSTVTLEYASEGKAVATGRPYSNRYISVVTIKDRKDRPLAGLSRPAPRLRGTRRGGRRGHRSGPRSVILVAVPAGRTPALRSSISRRMPQANTPGPAGNTAGKRRSPASAEGCLARIDAHAREHRASGPRDSTEPVTVLAVTGSGPAASGVWLPCLVRQVAVHRYPADAERLAISVALSPRSRRARAAASLSAPMTAGRPPLRPWAFAATRPAMVRSWRLSQMSTTSLTERPSRSSFHTTRVSPGRR